MFLSTRSHIRAILSWCITFRANIEVWTLTSFNTVAEAQQSELSTLFLEGGRKEKDLNLLGILVGGTI